MTKEIKVTELIEGKPIFESKGVSKVKVTRNGDVQTLVFPICSTGVAELIDALAREAPQPPIKNELVKADSELGRQMGLGSKRWVKMPNLADPAYVKAKEKHNQDMGLAIMLQGLELKIKDKTGNVIEDDGQKVKMLKGMGMTGDQFMQIVRDIQSLTKWKEEEEDRFFGES